MAIYRWLYYFHVIPLELLYVFLYKTGTHIETGSNSSIRARSSTHMHHGVGTASKVYLRQTFLFLSLCNGSDSFIFLRIPQGFFIFFVCFIRIYLCICIYPRESAKCISTDSLLLLFFLSHCRYFTLGEKIIMMMINK